MSPYQYSYAVYMALLHRLGVQECAVFEIPMQDLRT